MAFRFQIILQTKVYKILTSFRPLGKRKGYTGIVNHVMLDRVVTAGGNPIPVHVLILHVSLLDLGVRL